MSTDQNNSSTGLIIILILAAVLIVAVIAVAMNAGMPSTATIENPLTITIDAVPVSNTTIIDWGNLTWGTTYNKTITVKNISNQNLTLTLKSNEPNGTLHTWTSNNTRLDSNGTVTNTLQLSVVDAPPGNYNWTISILYTVINSTSVIP